MTERLRVLRLIARMNVGGPALHVGLLTARLDPERFESLLGVGRPTAAEGDMTQLRPSLGAELEGRIVHIPGLGREVSSTGELVATRAIAALVRSFRPHIVHTHTAKAGAIGRVVARSLRVPVVLHTFHGTVFQGHFGGAASRAIVTSERALGRLSDAVVAVSPAVAENLAFHRIGGRRVRVVPLGLDLEPLLAVPALPALSSDRRPVVTLVARLVPVKDVPFFFDAVRLLQARVPNVDVRIAGDGPDRQALETIAPDGVRFLGFAADLASILAESDVVALSSRSEGSPVALIEALAAGRPVAAVPVGGVPDVLTGRPGAALAESRTPEALAAAIHEALTSDDIRRGADEGRAKVIADYGAERLLGDVSSLYEELWAARRR